MKLGFSSMVYTPAIAVFLLFLCNNLAFICDFFIPAILRFMQLRTSYNSGLLGYLAMPLHPNTQRTNFGGAGL
jgi:hypothetical protein